MRLSEELIYYSRIQAEKTVRKMKEAYIRCIQHPDSGDIRHKCVTFKHALVQATTILKKQGNLKLAKIYEDAYKKMVLPKKGKHFRPYPENSYWED